MYPAPSRKGQDGEERDFGTCSLSCRTARPFQAHLPETLDLSAVTQPSWAAYAAWVVSAVVFRRFIDRGADETTYVPLGKDYMNKHIPAKVRRPLLDDLLAAGVLECDGLYYFNAYTPGGRGKSLCYRLGAAYRGVPIRARPVTDRELQKKMAVAWAAERAAVTDPTHLALRAWHDQVEVTADAPYGQHPLLDRMLDGERRFTVCEQGRLHTNCANLPAQYRQFVRLAGRELESVDISTSQPLLLALLLRNPTHTKGKAKEKKTPAVLGPCSDPSLNDFLEDCLGGIVYDRVAAQTGYTRDEVKPLFLAVIYGQPEHMETKVGRAVRSLYPGVYAAVVEMNFRLGHGGLPRLMQRLESGVMIQRVAGRLVREAPDMLLLTVHDSMLVPAEHVERVRAFIAEEWLAEFGVAPQTKTSAFTAPQAARVGKRRGKGRPGTPLAA